MNKIDITLILLFSLFNFFLIINFKKLSQFFNIYDIPDKLRKKHHHKISLLGGTLILLPFLFSIIMFLINDNKFLDFNQIFFENKKSCILFFLGCIFMYLIGIFDDKFNLSYLLKFLITSIVIVFLLYLDESILINKIHLSFYQKPIDISKINIFFTCLCFLLFINAINMFDGIDGQVGFYSSNSPEISRCSTALPSPPACTATRAAGNDGNPLRRPPACRPPHHERRDWRIPGERRVGTSEEASGSSAATEAVSPHCPGRPRGVTPASRGLRRGRGSRRARRIGGPC